MKIDVYKVTVTWEVIADNKVDASGTVGASLGAEIWKNKFGVKVGDVEKVKVPDDPKTRS